MTSPSGPVRVRFAPSPTGYLHVGGARTALYNYLLAKKTGGQFILRIEDTDEARSTTESMNMVMEDLQWLGIQWDEGPAPKTLEDKGAYGPYRQSQRLQLYRKYADQLIHEGKAYHCFMTDIEIEAQRAAQEKEGHVQHIRSPYAGWTLEQAMKEIEAGKPSVVRFRTEHLKKDYVFTDLVRGEVRFPSDMVGDFVLLRSGGMPVYNFCNVIDDGLMKITHVLRAEEHLPNTLRQLMLYEALGWTPPQFGHLSLILDEDRKKLSKRKGATSCHEFKMEGYLPEALNNFIALLGWSAGSNREVMSLSEMIAEFDIARFQPSGAVFDSVKLKWMNSVYLRQLSGEELWNGIAPFLDRNGIRVSDDSAWRLRAVENFRSALETFADAVELFRPLADSSYVILPESDEVLRWETSASVFQAWREVLSEMSVDHLSVEMFNQAQDEVKNRTGQKGKNLFMPIRVCVIGKPQGPDLKLLVPLIPRTSLIRRVDRVLEKLGST